MTVPRQPIQTGGEEVNLEEIGHPRGTLAIVIIFGLAFGLAWFAMYVFEFLSRGAPHS
jgi:hypothetical protein